jgi:integrase
MGRDAEGKPLQATKTVTGGKREAQAALRKFITEVEHSRVPERSITVKALLERWLDHITPTRRPSTIDRYRRKIDKAINPVLGGVRIDRLSAEHLDRQYRAWLDAGLSPSTVHVYHAILSASLRQAVKWGWLDRSPAQQASPPAQAHSQARSVSPEDLQRLVAAAEEDDPTLATAVALAALTGSRRGELCALRWSDVDLVGGILTVSRSYTPVNGQRVEGPTKTHQIRRLALDPIAIEILSRRWDFQRWYADQVEVPLDPDPYILSRDPRGAEPGHPDYLSHAFGRLNKRLGLDYHLHELRHFTATTAIAGGADIRTVASRLGHADPSVTLRIYAHAIEARDREVAAILGQALRPQLDA